MLRSRDIILIAVAVLGMALGVLFPNASGAFSPFVLYMMMTILFFSFFRIDFPSLVRMDAAGLAEVAVWTGVKLLLLPLALWALASWLAPEYALAVLLLAGTSAGVTAPFFAGLLKADGVRVLQVVVFSSLILPLSLPSLVSLLMGRTLDIPFSHMARMLGMVIFIPLIASLVVKKLWPGFSRLLDIFQYPVNTTLFFLINLGVFSSYSEFILANKAQVLDVIVISAVMGLLQAASGPVLARAWPGRLNGLTGAVAMTYVNNVLIIVFAGRFFEAQCPLLAAAYMLPLFGMLAPLRRLAPRESVNPR